MAALRAVLRGVSLASAQSHLLPASLASSQALFGRARPFASAVPNGAASEIDYGVGTEEDVKELDATGAFASTTVGHVLSAKAPGTKEWLWCDRHDTVLDAIRKMTDNNVGALVVLQGVPGATQPSEMVLDGIITERDYLKKLILQGRTSSETSVGDVMTPRDKLVMIDHATPVLWAMDLMTENRIRHIPVVDSGNHVTGVISIGDLVKSVVHCARENMDIMRQYIQGNGY